VLDEDEQQTYYGVESSLGAAKLEPKDGGYENDG
jgi:hypothetical protein